MTVLEQSLPILLFVSTAACLVAAGSWFRSVRRGDSVPDPGTARKGMWLYVLFLFFFTTDAVTAASAGNKTEAIWLALTALNIVFCIGLLIGIDRAAEDRAYEERLRR
jgi:hypothetical protein